ncbi:glycerol-3-phosphate dehydrogenase/oxidase [Granulicella tundricola]|uniref:Glycerol-3-phosphate dehydrogenase n=1 Tax=Granulicella tundricola (strain ATCC BAA-1859 / DSM 23138 / MP5ACTX9) TaxID=1198114 RepID=E8WY85_GRATM|nr:glycerol-3-phosphate dehydrogenase/oxidase [Granulicella tundricola]ADW68712.1 Glycerol-3-phosphate dehydrogenase [Granulicella tundricola MP5ACTX9]
MNREEMIERVKARTTPWDIVIIGGGAVGAGVAVDAASRGLDVLLVEREDFGKGTSSRATKLVHGGVRYLEQGNVSLVMEALKERGLLLQNAPHLVHDLPFVVPNYSWWEAPFYGIGMKIYDLLAGKYGFGKSRVLSLAETLERLPTIQQEGLRGGVLYHDGQFDDTRLLTHLIVTAVDHGATVLNYASAVEMLKDSQDFLNAVIIEDRESGNRHTVGAKVVVNATGIFTDDTRRLANLVAEPMVSPSQGIHLVFDRSFLAGDSAIMVPHTSDGRVLFAIPWHDRTLVGTTDTPIDKPSYEPHALEEEIAFVLDTAAQYLSRPPTREDVLSIYVGIRPLVKAAGSDNSKTSALSRDHTIQIDASGLITIVGGKWTTYRHMAEDCVNHAITLGDLPDTPCVTFNLHIHGYDQNASRLGSLAVYGTDAAAIQQLIAAQPELGQLLHPDLPYIAAEIVWAARHEMSRSLDDALARRTRALLLNARATIAIAPKVAHLLAIELKRDATWEQAQVETFTKLATQYVLQPASAATVQP